MSAEVLIAGYNIPSTFFFALMLFSVLLTVLLMYHRRLHHVEEIVRSAPNDHRIAALHTIKDGMSPDTGQLSSDHQYSLALRILDNRDKRSRRMVVVIFVSIGLSFLGTILLTLATKVQAIDIEISSQGFALAVATHDNFKSEVLREAAERAERAEHHFLSGKDHYDAREFRIAGAEFSQSIKTVPTMSAYLNLGDSYLELHEYAAAEEALQAGLSMATSRNDHHLISAFHTDLAAVYATLGKVEECERNLELSGTQGEPRYYLTKGICEAQEGSYKEALRTLSSGWDLLKNEEPSGTGAAIQLSISSIYITTYQIAKAYEPAQLSLKLWIASGKERARAPTIYNIGLIQEYQDDPVSAMQSYKSAADLAEQNADMRTMAKANEGMGNILSVSGNLPLAFQHYDIAQRMFASTGYKPGEASVLRAKALALVHPGGHFSTSGLDYLQANELLRNSIQLMEPWPNSTELADCLALSGMVHYCLHQKSLAIAALRRAVEIYERSAPDSPMLIGIKKSLSMVIADKHVEEMPNGAIP